MALDVHQELMARRDNPTSVNGWFRRLAGIMKERRYRLEEFLYGDGAKLIAPSDFITEYTAALEWSQFAVALARSTCTKKKDTWGESDVREIELGLKEMEVELCDLRKLNDALTLAKASTKHQNSTI